MARTTKVGLDVDEKPFTRGMDRAAKSAEGLEDALDDVTESAKDTTAATERAKDSTEDLGDSAKDAGQDLNRLRADAERLDRQIDETARGVRDLARAIAATSDEAERAKLTEKLSGEQGKLRSQTSLRKLIDFNGGDAAGVGGQLAEQVSLSFAARLGPLLARAPMAGMNPAVLAIGAPIAAGVATLVGTATAGAIIGGVGLGGVIGGLKLASRDARVQQEGKALGKDVGDMLGRASVSFVPVTLDAIKTVRRETLKMEPELRRVFGAASDYVEPLTDGLMDAAHNAMPGIIDAMESAGPVIDAVADGMRDIGSAVGDSLSDLSEYADEGARALTLLFKTVEYGIRATSNLVEGTAMLYGWSEKMAALWTGGVPQLAGLVTEEQNAELASRGLAGGLTGVMDTAVGALGGAVALSERQKILNSDMNEGIAAAGGLSEAFKLLNGNALSAREAERGYQEAIDAVSASIKANGTSLDDNTAKGRANNQAIDNLVTSIDAKAQAVYDETLATKGQAAAETAAKGVYEQGRTQLIKNLTAILGNKDAAIALADKIMKIPTSWGTTVTTPGMEAAIAAAKRLKARIDEIDRRIDIKATMTTSYGGGAHTGQGYSTGMRWGGVVEHAQDGLVNLRQAGIYGAVAPARYAFAEPATGGEAFIPRFGDSDRSLGILQQAAKWYGAAVVPGGGAGGGGMAGAPEVRVFIGDQELRGMVRVEVSEHNRGLKRRVGAGAGR